MVIVLAPKAFRLREAVEGIAVLTELGTGACELRDHAALGGDIALCAIDVLGVRQLPDRTGPVHGLHQRRTSDVMSPRNQRLGIACACNTLRAQSKYDGVVRIGVEEALGTIDQRIRVDLVGRSPRGRIAWELRLAFGRAVFAEPFHRSSTQVSLVPPPCDELTTSDPSRRATRVRPPGTIVTSLPDNTN